MVSRVGIPETALQLPTIMLKTLISLNNSYDHEWLEISLHMLPDGIGCQSVCMDSTAPIPNLLVSVSRRNGLSKTSFLKCLKGILGLLHEHYSLTLLTGIFPR